MRMLTVEEVIELFNLKRTHIISLAKKRHIPAVKIGRFWRFPENELQLWVKHNITPTNEIDQRVEEIMENIK